MVAFGRGASQTIRRSRTNAASSYGRPRQAQPVLALTHQKAVRKGATLVVAEPPKICDEAASAPTAAAGNDGLLNAMMNTISRRVYRTRVHPRRHGRLRGGREIVMRYSPEDAEKIKGARPRTSGDRPRVASEKPAGFYTLGITEHAGGSNIWFARTSCSCRATGRVEGLTHAGQTKVQGLNDSGANVIPPGYKSVDDPEIRRSSRTLGLDVRRGGLPPRPDRPGLHDGRTSRSTARREHAQTEQNARHVEEVRRARLLVSQDSPERLLAEVAHVVLPRRALPRRAE